MSISRYTTPSERKLTRYRWDCPWCKTTRRGMFSRVTAENEERTHRKLCSKRPVERQLLARLAYSNCPMSETALATATYMPWQRVHGTMKKLHREQRVRREPNGDWSAIGGRSAR